MIYYFSFILDHPLYLLFPYLLLTFWLKELPDLPLIPVNPLLVVPTPFVLSTVTVMPSVTVFLV